MTTDMIARLAAIKDIPTPRLIELAAADADGRLVVMPVPIPKVGDVVYELIDKRIIKSVVTGVNLAGISIIARSKDGGCIIFGVYDIGKIVFLTRQEAEAAKMDEEVAP